MTDLSYAIHQGLFHYYPERAQAFMRASDLGCLYVSSIMDEDEGEAGVGIQRPENPKRFPDIARHFLSNGHCIDVTPLIVWVRLATERDIEEFGQLYAGKGPAACVERFGEKVMTLIDGQHRRGGLMMACKEAPKFDAIVPLQMRFGDSIVQAAKDFVAINDPAHIKGVPGANVEFLKWKMLDAQSDGYDQYMRNLTDTMNTAQLSPFYGEIDMTGSSLKKVAGKPAALNLMGFARGLKSMLPEQMMRHLRAEGVDPSKVMMTYWTEVKGLAGDYWDFEPKVVKVKGTPKKAAHKKTVFVNNRLRDVAGFGALCFLGRDLVRQALLESRRYDVPFEQALVEAMAPLGEVQWHLHSDKRPNAWTYGVGGGWSGASAFTPRLREWVLYGSDPAAIAA